MHTPTTDYTRRLAAHCLCGTANSCEFRTEQLEQNNTTCACAAIATAQHHYIF